MKNLKNMFAWTTLALVLTVGTIGANAGIIVTDVASTPCSEGSSDGGIIVTDFTGIMIADGVMIADANCQTGVMLAD